MQKILTIDDELNNLKYIKMVLGKELPESMIITVQSGQEGLKIANKELPDIILLDILMPGMDGYEMCRRLKADERTHDIPVLFISTLDEAFDKLRAFHAGGVDYITKPFQAEELLARVETHLNLRKTQKQLEEQNIQLQQKIAEYQQVERTLWRLKKAIETTGVGVTITDNSGRIIYTNPTEAAMHGYTIDELVGQPSNIFTVPEYREPARGQGEDVEIFENWERERINMRKNGSVFPVRLTSNPIYDTQKFRIGTVTVCEDITDWKQVEDVLRNAKEAAEAANRAKSAFLAHMSHELRTPLNAILGFSQLLSRRSNLDTEQREYLNIINRSGEHLLTLINQVLDLSKIEAGRMTLEECNFDLYRLLDDLFDLFRLRAEKKSLQLRCDRTPDVPRYVCADEVKLRQVLLNLINNAIKFTENGRVTLEVTTVPNMPEGPKVEGVNLQFSISDTGPGIAPDELEYVFEAFRQTKTGRETQEGTGLGLTISRKFVELMNGELTITSQVEHGTIVTFEIPVDIIVAAGVETKTLPSRVIALASNQSRYRVLIVDDNQENRSLFANLLRPFGFDLREAENGQKAIDIWQTWCPHVIFMDLHMPVLDGYAATQKIRHSTSNIRNIPIIAITASPFEDIRTAALIAGCDDLLGKPFRESEIFGLLHKHLGVQFIDAQEEQIAGDKSLVAGEAVVIPTALARLSPDLLDDLEHAALLSDVDLMNLVLQTIRAHDPALTDALGELADRFAYGEILNMIREGKKDDTTTN